LKAVFLDIDGVLNSDFTTIYTKSGAQFIENIFVERLCRIIKETNAEVVLSSDWRYDREPPYNSDFLELEGKLREYGIKFYGFTPIYLAQDRGFEINKYLEIHPEIKKFVILDDRCDMLPHKHRLVRTDPKIGLTDDDVEEAIWLLNN
jgi:hypothetical protein